MCWYINTRILASGAVIDVNLLHQESDKMSAIRVETKSVNSKEK
jgi:hypothetical protein